MKNVILPSKLLDKATIKLIAKDRQWSITYIKRLIKRYTYVSFNTNFTFYFHSEDTFSYGYNDPLPLICTTLEEFLTEYYLAKLEAIT